MIRMSDRLFYLKIANHVILVIVQYLLHHCSHTSFFHPSQVFSPLLSRQDEWGLVKKDTREHTTFITQLTKFDDDLKRKIANLRGDVELRTPQPPHDKIEQKPASYAKAAKDKAVLEHFQGKR